MFTLPLLSLELRAKFRAIAGSEDVIEEGEMLETLSKDFPWYSRTCSTSFRMTPEFMAFTLAATREHRIIAGNPDAGERTGLLQRRRLETRMETLVRLKMIPEAVPLERLVRFDLLTPDLVE